jgi:uncharacterized protein (TIGR02145 family)
MKKIFLFFIITAYITINCQAQTVTDIDENIYNTVTIGSQIWMKENLKVKHYNNGDEIPNVSNNISWFGLTTGAYCDYENDGNVATVYGRLYNWFAGNDSRGICPVGWHLPSYAEWMTLINNLGGENIAGEKLKESGTVHWMSPNTCANNDAGFLALPGGLRASNVNFSFIGFYGYWWSSTGIDAGYAWRMHLGYDYCNSFMDDFNKSSGFSIRCIKNEPTGINELELNNDIQIYPIPAINTINIKYHKYQVTNVKVYNLIGECILDKALDSEKTEITINSLSKGIYIIELKTKDLTIWRKLIRE